MEINRHDTVSKPCFEPLEPRTLLSADPVGTEADSQMPDPGREAAIHQDPLLTVEDSGVSAIVGPKSGDDIPPIPTLLLPAVNFKFSPGTIQNNGLFSGNF